MHKQPSKKRMEIDHPRIGKKLGKITAEGFGRWGLRGSDIDQEETGHEEKGFTTTRITMAIKRSPGISLIIRQLFSERTNSPRANFLATHDA